MRALSTKKTLTTLAVLLGLVTFTAMGHKAAASTLSDGFGDGFSTTAPTPGSARYNANSGDYINPTSGSTVTPYYDVGNVSSDYTYSTMEALIYVKKSFGPVTVQINNGYADCYQYSGGGVVGPDYTSNGGVPIITYTVIGAGGTSIVSKTVSSGGCGAVFIPQFNTSLAYNITPTPDFDGVFKIDISVAGPGEGENSFQIISGSWGGVTAGSKVYGLGYRAQDLNDITTNGTGNFWDGWTDYALPMNCNSLLNPITSSEIIYYKDMDTTRTDWNRNMVLVLERQLINNDGTTGSSWAAVSDTAAQPNPRFQSQMGDNGQFNFTASSNYRYRIVMANIGVRNTIRIQTSSGLSPLYASLAERPTTARCLGTASCTATATPGNPAPGQAVTVTVKLTNTSGSTGPTFPTTYQVRQVSYLGSPPGNARTLPSALAPGQSELVDPNNPFNITGRPAGSVVTFYYQLFNGTSSGSAVIGPSPPCPVTIAWGVPNGNFAINCKQTTIWGLSSTATYQYPVTTTTAGYYTYVHPEFFYLYPNGPPPATPPYLGEVFWYPGTTTTTYQTAQVTKIPIKITFQGTDGSNQQYTTILPTNPSGTVTYNTFVDFASQVTLWPHLAYSAQLYAQLSGPTGTASSQSAGIGPGPYDPYYTPVGTPQVLTPCLHASLSTACIGPSTDPGPVEPGQRYDFSYQIQLTNDTLKTFSASDAGGYNIFVYTTGGLAYLGGNPASASPISPGTSNITVQVPVRVDYSGTFWVQFRFQGNQLSLDDWPGVCGPPGGPGTSGSDTPATRPYFQVWYGDTKAGGGFRSPSLLGAFGTGSCGGTGDPPYVTPAASNDTGYKDQYSGGIRAFGWQASNRGSRTDFGAMALGLIPGSTGGAVGFFSGINQRAMFANTVGANPPGGYLNTNSDEHCVDDYFSDTRITPNPPAFGGGDLTNLPSGQYLMSGGSISGGSIQVNKQITIYVDGNLTINGDINYASAFNPNDPTNIPYLAIIARGNITITGGVGRLDGLYIAQPKGTSGGVFATCDSVCTNQLVINGAVIAQHVQLLRTHGTCGCQGTIDADVNGIGTTPGEIINFVPSMIIGSPMFSAHFGTLEGLFSLPPVF